MFFLLRGKQAQDKFGTNPGEVEISADNPMNTSLGESGFSNKFSDHLAPVSFQEIPDEINVVLYPDTSQPPSPLLVSGGSRQISGTEDFVPVSHLCFPKSSFSVDSLELPPTLDGTSVLSTHELYHGSLVHSRLHFDSKNLFLKKNTLAEVFKFGAGQCRQN